MTPLLKMKTPSLRQWGNLPSLESVAPASRGLVSPPVWWDYELTAQGGNRYPVLGNDIESDCVIAWELHTIESQWRRLVAERKVVAPDVIATGADADAAFWAEVDRQAASPQPHVPPGPGLNPVQAVIDWKNYGLKCATETNFAAGAVTITSKEPSLIRYAAYNCAGLGLMLELPDNYTELAAQSPQAPWSVSGAPDPSLGHMALLSGYSGSLVGIKSWGQAYSATWDWVFTYCVGMIGVLGSDWVSRMGSLDITALEAKLVALGGNTVF